MHPCEEKKDGCRAFLTLPHIYDDMCNTALKQNCCPVNFFCNMSCSFQEDHCQNDNLLQFCQILVSWHCHSNKYQNCRISKNDMFWFSRLVCLSPYIHEQICVNARRLYLHFFVILKEMPFCAQISLVFFCFWGLAYPIKMLLLLQCILDVNHSLNCVILPSYSNIKPPFLPKMSLTTFLHSVTNIYFINHLIVKMSQLSLMHCIVLNFNYLFINYYLHFLRYHCLRSLITNL